MESRLNTRALSLLLLFTVLGLYYPAIFAPLSSVDDPGMYHYLLNKDSFNLREIFIPGGTGTYYRPLLSLSFFVDKYVWGLEESFMHLQNIALHLCNVLLLFAVGLRAGRLMGVVTPIPAFLAAMFFAIHPINTESVAWISGRTDPLACLFLLLSTFFLLNPAKNVVTDMASALCLLVACLAKETAFFFLPTALVLPFFVLTGGKEKTPLLTVLKDNMLHIVIFATAGTCYLSFRLLAFSRGDAGMSRFATHVAGGQGADFLLTVRLVLKAAGFYLKKLFVPFPLNFGIVHVSDLYMIPGLLLCLAVVWLLLRRTLPGFFFISALSVGLSALMIPILKITWTPLAERYMYIPSAFFLVGLTFTVFQCEMALHYRKVTTAVIACLAAVALYGTAQRVLLWQDNLAFFQDTRRKSPDFIPAQNELAVALYARGMTSEAGTVIKSMRLSEDLNNYQYGLITRSAAHVREGDIEGARTILRQALLNPGRHEAAIIQRLLKLNDRDVIEKRAGQAKFYSENVRLLTRLHEITGEPFYLYRLGQIHMFMGDRLKARDAFQRVVAQTTAKVYYHTPAKKLLEKLSN